MTGPLTSLATAIRRDPDLPARLRRLVIMGGAFHTHGNTTPTSEWNVAVDPEAAAEVFSDEQLTAIEWTIVLINSFNRISIASGHPVRLKD